MNGNELRLAKCGSTVPGEIGTVDLESKKLHGIHRKVVHSNIYETIYIQGEKVFYRIINEKGEYQTYDFSGTLDHLFGNSALPWQ